MLAYHKDKKLWLDTDDIWWESVLEGYLHCFTPNFKYIDVDAYYHCTNLITDEKNA